MEDIFESLFPVIILLLPLLFGKKNRNKARPGKARQPQVKPAPVRKERKIVQDWIEQMELADVLDEDEEEDREADGLQPQYLQPEPLVPEKLEPERLQPVRLQETGLSEGSSRTDDFGCVGGSMGHAADGHHQGEDFHAAGTHAARRDDRDEPVMVERVKPAVSAADLRKAVIWKEILDRPVSMREQA